MEQAATDAIVKLTTTQAQELHTDYYTMIERTIMMSVLVFCILITLTGNSIMLWSIACVPVLQTVNNVFLASLCCANLVMGSVTMPLIASSMMSNQSSEDLDMRKVWLCNLSGFVDNGAMVGFMWTLTLLSIDRCVLIRYPIWYKCRQNKNRAAILLLVTWTFSLLLVVPPIFGVGRYSYSEWIFSCGITPIERRDATTGKRAGVFGPSFYYFTTFSILNSVLPIPIVLCANLHILKVLLTTRRIRKEAVVRRYRRSALLLITLTAYLMLTLSPVFIGSYLYIVNLMVPDKFTLTFPSMRVLLASHMLFLGNGAVTPIFFGLFNSSIRSKYVNVVRSQTNNLRSSLIRHFHLGKHNISGSSFSASIRRMMPSVPREKSAAPELDEPESDQGGGGNLIRLVVPKKNDRQVENNTGTQQTILTDIGYSPFDNQRFVFPLQSSEGFERALLRVWDEEYERVQNIESTV